jgi:AraC family transcriptional regulator
MKQQAVVSQQQIKCSPYYEIKNLSANIPAGEDRKKGYNDCFCLLFSRKGHLTFEHLGYKVDLFNGLLLADKPGYHFQMHPAIGECTIINFSDSFYQQLVQDLQLDKSFFFSNSSLLSLLLKTNAQLDYLHYQLAFNSGDSQLSTDNLILEIVKIVAAAITQIQPKWQTNSPSQNIHLTAVERSKEYIHQHFQKDFSLFDLAKQSLVSPFHFSRIFKQYTSQAPHQYVTTVRLKHSAMLLKHTKLTITDVAYQSGFSNADYFSTAFKKWIGIAPANYRLSD